MLASVQAHLLVHLFRKNQTITPAKALQMAFADILWNAGENSAVLVFKTAHTVDPFSSLVYQSFNTKDALYSGLGQSMHHVTCFYLVPTNGSRFDFVPIVGHFEPWH